jgi:PAS domain S-box-containing protein
MAQGGSDKRDRERRLALLVDSVMDYAIFVLDVDGRVRSWSNGARRLKGYEADEIIGQHFSVFYPQEEIARGKPELELAVASATGRFEDEGWRLRKDGEPFWANVIITALRGEDGQLLGFGKVTRDLTERRRGEEATRESEERFRLLVDSAEDYAIFMLDADGRITSWNTGAQRLKGYRPDEIIGRHFSIFYPTEDVRNGKPDEELAIAISEGRVEDEGWRVRKDGTRFWANVVISALRDKDGKLRGFAKVTRDLTDRKMAEDALRGILERERDTSDRLRELDRLRNQFVAMVAHDLRSPLSVIAGFTQLLRAEWDTTSAERRSDFLDRIDRSVRGLQTLVDDVLEVATIESGELTYQIAATSLGGVVRGVIEQLVAPTDAARIVVSEPDRALSVMADERRVWQVVANLISNALKFSPAGSPVEVTIDAADAEVVLSVHDQGPGIPPEDQDKLFRRFSQLSGPSRDLGRGGTGLGLFIAKSLVEEQGGRIGVRSAPGEGSTFWFSLPRAVETA